MLIYKIFRSHELAAFRAEGTTDGAPIDVADGYIHFSAADQVAGTLSAHFAGESDLSLLAVPTEPLGDALKWERSRGGQLFPHLYRPLGSADVAWVRDIRTGPDGHVLPDLD